MSTTAEPPKSFRFDRVPCGPYKAKRWKTVPDKQLRSMRDYWTERSGRGDAFSAALLEAIKGQLKVRAMQFARGLNSRSVVRRRR